MGGVKGHFCPVGQWAGGRPGLRVMPGSTSHHHLLFWAGPCGVGREEPCAVPGRPVAGRGACSQVASEAGSGDVATMPKDSSATTWPPEGPALVPLGSPLSNHALVVQTSPGHQEAGDRSHLQGGRPFLSTGLDDSWGQALCLLGGPWGRGGGGRPRAVCVQESQRPPLERLVGSGHALCQSMV